MSTFTRRALVAASAVALTTALVGCSASVSVNRSVSQGALEEKVAEVMDSETGTTFPVECEGGIDGEVDATQQCWRIITGLADQGVPDDSRLGLTITVTSVDDDGPQINVQADDAITPPQG